MWGQDTIGDPDEGDSQSVVEGSVVEEASPKNVATASKNERELLNRLEDEMQTVLDDLTASFSVNIPFAKEDKERIVDNLNIISEENEGEDLDFTRAVLVYMLKELGEVFPEYMLRNLPSAEVYGEGKYTGSAAAIGKRTTKTEAAGATEAEDAQGVGLGKRKRQRFRGPVRT